MRVEALEKRFLWLSGGLLVACLAALVYASTARGIHLPTHDAIVDPATLPDTPPFDQPGVREIGPGRYEVVLVARTWVFTPNEIRIPAGAEVTFVATSGDVLHGLLVAGTRVNVMLIPGQVTRLTHRFREPGEHLLICHEYCGIGHHQMVSRMYVK